MTKDRNQEAWEPSFFAFRSPLLPFATLTALGTPPDADDDAAIEAARARGVDALRDLVRADPAVREALFVASPSLDAGIDAWLRDPADARARGVSEVVLRYVARMAARPTPFGLFSGCSIGRIGEQTALVLPPRSAYRRHTRLDMHYLDALCDALQREPAIRAELRFQPSTGLYATPTHWRYAEAHTDPETRAKSYHLVSVERTPYLDATLERARTGERASALAEALVESDQDIAREEADGFVDALVDNQILVSDLVPPITGGEPLGVVVDTLRASHAGEPYAQTLADVGGALRALDASGVGASPSRYRDVANTLEPLPARAELARLFQVDLYKPAAEATLGHAVIKEIKRGVDLLAKIGVTGENEALRRFREAFVERYEQREVPLVEALDDEAGLGFDSSQAGSSEPSPLLEGLEFPPDDAPPRAAFGPREHRLLAGIDTARRTGAVAWTLDDDDVAALAAKRPHPLPDVFAAMAVLVAGSRERLLAGDFRIDMHGIAGPSGAMLLGRFCHGDPELRARVEEHLRAEEALAPEAIFAEIVHLSEGRLGNILCRPALRPYEIHFLGRGAASGEHRIGVGELLVSVRGGRIVLRCPRLGREIVPRMTTAHNHANAALGLYRFLCALQAQPARPPGFSWGPLGNAPFLPRVVHGKIVVSHAQWTVGKQDIQALATASGAARMRAVRAMRERLRIPRWVQLADGDNQLPVDFDHPLHVDSFVGVVKARDRAVLSELPAQDDLAVEGPEGRYTHELVVPFVQSSPSVRRPISSTDHGAVTRSFAPGSEWLYAKLYTGTATADVVLREVVAPLVARARESGVLGGWFFLRYGDPDWHVRVRFLGDPARLAAEVLPALSEIAAPLLADGRVRRVQLDTYVRELERYGGADGIVLAERLFEADSDAALAIVEATAGQDDGARARCDLALVGSHRLLCDLGFDLARRHAIMKDARARFGEEHRAGVILERQLGAKFRATRVSYEALLAGKVAEDDEPRRAGLEALDARSRAIEPIAKALREAAENDRLAGAKLDELAWSYVHMHVNRLLRSEQRAQELVIYDTLARLYEGEIARAKKPPKIG